MSSGFRLNWRGDQAAVVVTDATRKGLLQLGYQLEGEIKVGAPVDTGFMRNSTYVHSSGASTFQAQNGSEGQQTASSPPAADDDTVIVGVAADYAIYVESTQPFVYPAMQRIARLAGGVIGGAVRSAIK